MVSSAKDASSGKDAQALSFEYIKMTIFSCSLDVLQNKKASENRVAEMALGVLKLMPEPEKKPTVSSSAEVLKRGNVLLQILFLVAKYKNKHAF